MIKIKDILELVNNGIKAHYFKDFKVRNVCEIISRIDDDEREIKFPAEYVGDGQYESVQTDSNGLNIYYRILSLDNNEDLDSGFGRDSLTTEDYEIRAVVFGQKTSIEQSCDDINYYIAKEFKKLIPRSFNISDTNRISITGIEYDKEKISSEEFISYDSGSILFTIDMSIIIKGIERCNELKCDQ